MSSYTYIYLGVFIKGFYHYDEIEKSYIGCLCGERNKNMCGQFCEKCENQIVKMKKKETVKSFDFFDFDDKQYDGKYIEWIGCKEDNEEDNEEDNYDVLFIKDENNIELETRTFQFYEINDNIESRIEKFRKKYNKEINYLKKYYDKIVIEFGMVQVCR